jgi:isopenicillin N synthase-like dioxygenase
MDTLAVVDIAPFLQDPTSQQAIDACKQIVDVLKSTSCLIVRDPRVREEDNIAFLDLVEQYFSQPRDRLMEDVHPELSYQLGATPEFTEVPRDHKDVITNLKPEYAAHVPQGADPKWRFFWRIGERPTHSSFPELNGQPVVPSQFPQWESIMNKWGSLMLETVTAVAEMIAVGYGLPKNTITDLMHQGPHLLAPTGSDLSKYNQKDTVFAGFHYDFNLLTIHGKSRFPGLFIWLRDGSRLQVRVPDGCLLLQAGKQLEWLTGGTVTAGFHEVVVVDDTIAAVERAKAAGRPLWRVSSTLFSHVNSDKQLAPLPPFNNDATLAAYPPTLAGKQAEDELKLIALQQQ